MREISGMKTARAASEREAARAVLSAGHGYQSQLFVGAAAFAGPTAGAGPPGAAIPAPGTGPPGGGVFGVVGDDEESASSLLPQPAASVSPTKTRTRNPKNGMRVLNRFIKRISPGRRIIM